MPKQKQNTHQKSENQESVSLTAQDTKIAVAKKILAQLREDLDHLERLMASDATEFDVETLRKQSENAERVVCSPTEGAIVEGVFDGQYMIGSDGQQYILSPNYASKSKLVEGDILKLRIQSDGTFVFKQIGPIERQRVVGVLARDEFSNDWCVVALGKKFRVLTAAVSYHKGGTGDEAVILIPRAAPSKWAALENVIKKE